MAPPNELNEFEDTNPVEDRRSGDVANPGLLLRVRASVAAGQEVDRFLGVLKRCDTLSSTPEDMWTFRKLFFVARVLMLYVAEYQNKHIMLRLLRCAQEAGRIVGKINGDNSDLTPSGRCLIREGYALKRGTQDVRMASLGLTL
ncbi:MAG: hypothetical protein R3C52_06890 [Hyphomonadaceae bacterium]